MGEGRRRDGTRSRGDPARPGLRVAWRRQTGAALRTHSIRLRDRKRRQSGLAGRVRACGDGERCRGPRRRLAAQDALPAREDARQRPYRRRRARLVRSDFSYRTGSRLSTILVSGAGRGLGLELARQYAADGWRVIGTVRDAKVKLPPGVDRQIADVTDRGQIASLANAIREVQLDVLFCNAGIIGKRAMALGSFDYASWEEVLRVNVLGAAALAEALIDNVAASKLKVIAMMSSRLGSITESSGMTLPYATSKAALNMLVKGLAANLAGKRVIVV
ncbi:MAG: SDR family NAD(P)-dependent oxidoreductase, partial [Betaproteobacteria bacterium]|nr:SDR family NAD(P)-dependent oxidoreductase [Betaproteobacteria bacterium]MBV9360710.1 SDR family NAD(P)-dependent oxidoreductase [Betaproteobacteria bacterium]